MKYESVGVDYHPYDNNPELFPHRRSSEDGHLAQHVYVPLCSVCAGQKERQFGLYVESFCTKMW